MLFKLSKLHSNLALTLGYLNSALKNSALVFMPNITTNLCPFFDFQCPVFTGWNQSPFFDFQCFYSVKWLLLFSIYRDFTWYLPGRSKLSCLIYILFTKKYLRYIYMTLPLEPLNFTGLSPFSTCSAPNIYSNSIYSIFTVTFNVL